MVIFIHRLEQIEQKKQEILANKLKRSKKAGDAAGDEKEVSKVSASKYTSDNFSIIIKWEFLGHQNKISFSLARQIIVRFL